MDFKGNTKTNDANINDLLYCDDNTDTIASRYEIPADPGSGASYLRQPMNRQESASGLGNAANANDKIAMLNKLKQQQREQYERKKTQITGVKKLGERGSGAF